MQKAPNKVLFVDLAKQYASISSEINQAILKVAASGSFILGENVKAFEKEFAGYVGAKYGVGIFQKKTGD